MQFTTEDLKNLMALINRATITGEQATTVAILQAKLAKMLAEMTAPTTPPEPPTT